MQVSVAPSLLAANGGTIHRRAVVGLPTALNPSAEWRKLQLVGRLTMLLSSKAASGIDPGAHRAAPAKRKTSFRSRIVKQRNRDASDD